MEKRKLPLDSDPESEESEDIARDYLRISTVLGFLTHKPFSINLVESIRPFEVSLLKLLTKVTEGTRTEVTKDYIKLEPGRLTGGEFTFECDRSIPLAYYLEPLVLLFPFAARHTSITLHFPTPSSSPHNGNHTKSDGARNKPPLGANDEDEYLENNSYSSLECFCSVATIVLKQIGCESNFKFKEPFEVVFSCTPVKKVPPIDLSKPTQIKRIRGSVVVRNAQPSLGKRAIIGIKKVLDVVCDNSFVFLASPPGRFKPHITISLIAEGTNNAVHTANHAILLSSLSESYHSEADYATDEPTGEAGDLIEQKKVGCTSLKKILKLIEEPPNKPSGGPAGAGTPVADSKVQQNSDKDAKQNHQSGKNDPPKPTTKASDTNSCTINNHKEPSFGSRDTKTQSSSKSGEGSRARNTPKEDGLMERCELIGEQCALRLCSEISLDATLDTTHSHLVLFFMALAEDHRVSQVRLAKLTRYAVHAMRLIREHLGVTFKFQVVSAGTDEVLLARCVGSNFQNINIESF